MSALLYCAQTAGAVNKHIAKVNLPSIIVSPSKLRKTPTLWWMQFLCNWFKIDRPKPEEWTTGKSSSAVGSGRLNASSRRNTDTEKRAERGEDRLRLTAAGEPQEG